LKWAGANNPLWVIRAATGEVMTIKPDKQTVGKTENPKPFTTHTLQLEEGDCFYMFTDGYADQFGGENAKKFMQKRLKELLSSIYTKPMQHQLSLIHSNLLTWMGNLEQVDDICMAGIRL
jgi:serine phosphatase RsbU (regulator of sigma subunit)